MGLGSTPSGGYSAYMRQRSFSETVNGKARPTHLGVRHNLTILGVNARVVLRLALASLERAILRLVGHVVSASNAIIDMLAIVSGVGSSRVASLEAESVGSHEAVTLLVSEACLRDQRQGHSLGPLDNLLIRIVTVAERIRVHQPSKGVTTLSQRTSISPIPLAKDMTSLTRSAP